VNNIPVEINGSTCNKSKSKISQTLDGITPMEKWSGKRPSVAHLRIFGSPVYALDKIHHHKFRAKGKEYTFVGYSLTAKAYRLFDKEAQQVVEKRDVKFVENEEVSIIIRQALTILFHLS